MESIFIETKKIVDSAQRILLVSHEEPDGDALGSMLALKISLEGIGKQADIFSLSEIPESFKFLPGAESVKSRLEGAYDLIWGLDYGDLKRLETISSGCCPTPPTITFDHHILANQTGLINIVDQAYSSTCEIVYCFLVVNNLKITKEIATCLLAGIFTDTWSLRHQSATANTLKIVGDLLLKGAYLSKIVKLTSRNNIYIKSKVWGKALGSIFFHSEYGFVSCFLSRQEFIECRATADDISGLSSLLCSVPEAKFSLVLSENQPGRICASLRCNGNGDNFDVSKIANIFGGGGHRMAAAFKTEAKPGEIIEKIKNLLENRIVD